MTVPATILTARCVERANGLTRLIRAEVHFSAQIFGNFEPPETYGLAAIRLRFHLQSEENGATFFRGENL